MFEEKPNFIETRAAGSILHDFYYIDVVMKNNNMIKKEGVSLEKKVELIRRNLSKKDSFTITTFGTLLRVTLFQKKHMSLQTC